jgi:predicted N-acyltransferase
MPLRHRFVQGLSDVDAARWDALRGSDDPFTSHAFLYGLEDSGSLLPRWGWTPHHLLIEDADGVLQAAAPCYLKSNSHGEFVFDHAWAQAYHRAGLPYFPKLLVAVPYSPVNGPRLLCGGDPRLRVELVRTLEQFTREQGLSSAHLNFHTADQAPGGDWLARSDLQFHWHNAGYGDFEAFLAALSAKKRKNVRQERAQVVRAGIRLRRLHGNEVSALDLDTAHALYCRTFDEKGNHPALSREFFGHLARRLAHGLMMVLAEREGQTIAMALCLRSRDTLYGRYWGCFEEVPGLHFECCYYQGIEYCIEHGLQRFEPGAQGEHKLARGFLPQLTHSSHYLPMPAFREAVAASLVQEQHWLMQYRSELMAHSPYRSESSPA